VDGWMDGWDGWYMSMAVVVSMGEDTVPVPSASCCGVQVSAVATLYSWHIPRGTPFDGWMDEDELL
jgi:hypothetical protein